MPQFLDHHPIAHASLSEEAVEEIRTQIRAETPDDFGVKMVERIRGGQRGGVLPFGGTQRGSGGQVT